MSASFGAKALPSLSIRNELRAVDEVAREIKAASYLPASIHGKRQCKAIGRFGERFGHSRSFQTES